LEIPITFWVIFHGVVFLFLLIDLLSRGKAPQVSIKTDQMWSIIWIIVGLGFGVYVYWLFGYEEALKYVTAYVVEKSLSVDNLFVFLVIFNYFGVPFIHQHKTLFIGILSAIIFRGTFIFLGVTLLERFHWMVYVFGAILMYSGYKLARGAAKKVDPAKNRVVRVAKKLLPIHPEYVGGKFIVKQHKIMFTPLIVVLLAIETTDIMFALDSIPAVLAITQEFFTAYTSNIMAILGLRALYFVLAHAMLRLEYLSRGLAVVLFYLGLKFIVRAIGIEIPTLISLAIVMGIISSCVLASLLRTRRGASPKI
jgi:tellurite resistance protein TerC